MVSTMEQIVEQTSVVCVMSVMPMMMSIFLDYNGWLSRWVISRCYSLRRIIAWSWLLWVIDWLGDRLSNWIDYFDVFMMSVMVMTMMVVVMPVMSMSMHDYSWFDRSLSIEIDVQY